MNPETVAQRQLDAYNNRDLQRFAAQFSDDVQIFRLPATTPSMVGKPALREHYASSRFNRPNLRAELLNRMVMGNKVIDHERIHGVQDQPYEAVAIYQIVDGSIQTVWFLDAD